jgi:glycosyltransferase involved in cell wall biosynthesis
LVNTVSRQITDAFSSAARGAPVHVMRSYLAPLGLAVAERLGAPWTTLDLDDDDASFERARGHTAESEAFERLVGTFAPLFSAVAVASPTDASSLSERSGIHILVVPNAVAIPSPAVRDPPGHPEILFVGNLTYEPNVEAAEALALSILPRLRQCLSTSVSLTMVGAYEHDGRVASLRGQPGVELTGAVPDLAPYYARASVVVAPLPPGGGTKIKVLEAFAHRVPVVTTPSGTAGLDVTDGVEVLIGGDVDALVQRASNVLVDPAGARSVADRAFAYVTEHHAPTVAEGAVRRLLASAARSGTGPDRAIGGGAPWSGAPGIPSSSGW